MGYFVELRLPRNTTMSILADRVRLISRAAALAGILAMPAVASAESKIYPPGTDCANQPTIAERLLCGRQEFRREQGVSVEQPNAVPPAPSDEERPFPNQPMPPADLAPAPARQQLLPRTSSPNH
jgi:hypothetical protein